MRVRRGFDTSPTDFTIWRSLLLEYEHLPRRGEIPRRERIKIYAARYGLTHLICAIPIGGLTTTLIHANILMP